MKNIDLLLDVARKIKEKNLPFNVFNSRLCENGLMTNFISETECGTTGCLLGWCPIEGEGELKTALDNPENWDKFGNRNLLNFFRYSRNVFNITDEKWEWLFYSIWPNDIDAAIARIEYLLEYGEVPDEFCYIEEFIEDYRDDPQFKHFIGKKNNVSEITTEDN